MQVPRSLPRGKHSLAPDVVLISQRARVIEGMVAAVADKGYASTTVADVIRNAKVSRTTFYEQFRDKEDCFLAAFEAGARSHFRQVVASGDDTDGWLEQLRNGTRVYLGVLAAAPSYARALLVEAMAAGARARALSDRTQQRYVEMLKIWHAGARVNRAGVPELPDEVFQASVAAVNELVTAQLRAGQAWRLPTLEPVVLYTQLALFGFPEEASRVLAAATGRTSDQS